MTTAITATNEFSPTLANMKIKRLEQENDLLRHEIRIYRETIELMAGAKVKIER